MRCFPLKNYRLLRLSHWLKRIFFVKKVITRYDSISESAVCAEVAPITVVILSVIGLRQGSPTSCFLFTLFTNKLIRLLKSVCPPDGFLSPACRGRRILVAPGFCLASGVRRLASSFLVGAKTRKQLVIFFAILTSHS